MRSPRACAAVLIGTSLALAACSGGGAAQSGGRTAQRYAGPLAKEAWSGFEPGPWAAHSRLEMKQVERHSDRSVLRFYVTNLAKQRNYPAFYRWVARYDNLAFTLVDPVGHKAYTPLYEGSRTVGSGRVEQEPGVKYEKVLHFPPVPAGLRTLTVITPSTAGEFTGVPVVDGAALPMTPQATGSPGPVPVPMVPYTAKAAGGVYDLYGLTEGEVKSTVRSNTEERVGLRTDVLFAFDSAKPVAPRKGDPGPGRRRDQSQGRPGQAADPHRGPHRR